mmetsp:Transcript_122417/g.305578  ORF Transcript_122417/g.305578 Transcript_122417/m.305578 type:complete len:513 (-) Transcript_122417:142-1680(-)|eukprot:CAMPEP_0115304920 /NCGR_PEP_ID=MMETSP0270-20121206/71730_1 /TAXON_ID=71861 /ORGANISM="Scrippsiella trochoidea, Strain CCMP3099" /LENGTH=512 /DNA_ID=CAMNT_0002723059 /DNA_START=56 /DNA_END=1594 /DNA_ORIENTATION=+
MIFLVQLLNFVVAWAGSWKIGARFPITVGLPMIIGYMLVGVVCGKYVTGMLNPSTLNTADPYSVASIVTNMTVAFISLSAGCELHLPSLGMQKLRQIGFQIAFMVALMLGCGTAVLAALAGTGSTFMPQALLSEKHGCQWSVAWMLAVILLAGSVIEVLAIFHETKASGPVSQLMIGTTMLLDMLVVVLFAVAQNVVVSTCPMEGVHVSSVSAVIGICGQMVLCVLAGGILGGILRLYMMLPSKSRLGGATLKAVVLATGWACYYGLIRLNASIPLWAPSMLKMLRIDPLLVCMLSSSFLQHFSSHGRKLRELVCGIAPLVMPPFFTIVGATLDLGALRSYAGAVLIFFVVRAMALGAGSFLASVASRDTLVVRRHLWMTLQSQSGVTLALVMQMTSGVVGQSAWATDLATIITGCVTLNQLVGPTMCRVGIQRAGESHDSQTCRHDTASKDDASATLTPCGQERREDAALQTAWGVEFEATQRSLALVLPSVEEQLQDGGGEAAPPAPSIP